MRWNLARAVPAHVAELGLHLFAHVLFVPALYVENLSLTFLQASRWCAATCACPLNSSVTCPPASLVHMTCTCRPVAVCCRAVACAACLWPPRPRRSRVSRPRGASAVCCGRAVPASLRRAGPCPCARTLWRAPAPDVSRGSGAVRLPAACRAMACALRRSRTCRSSSSRCLAFALLSA